MLLITIVCSLLLIQFWGSGKPLQKDHWFFVLLDFFSQIGALARIKLGPFAVVLALTLCLALIIQAILGALSGWLAAAFAVVVLVYAMGRGEFNELASDYLSALRVENWDSAVEAAQAADVNTLEVEEGDWSNLNHLVVSHLAYRGFERLFAVIFWFVVAGVVGALAYRLISLYQSSSEDSEEDESLCKVLWILEWPVVRLFGLSLAVTGNFASCISRCRKCLLRSDLSTQQQLVLFVESALSIDENESEDPRCGRREMTELVRLYTRTLVLWVCVIALVTLFG